MNKNNFKDEQNTLLRPDYAEEILAIIRSGADGEDLKDRLLEYHYNDIASVLEELELEEREKLYKILGVDEVSDIFAYLDNVEDYIGELDEAKAADIIEEMDADDAVDVLEELPEEKQDIILNLLDKEAREDIALITSYEEDVIGSKMTTNFIVVKNYLSIKAVMRALVEQAADNDNVSTIFVIDEYERFYGAVDLRDLIVSRADDSLADITATKYPYLYATDLVEDCYDKLREYQEDSIPILDGDNRLIGVVTASDITEVVHEEIADDYAKLGGLSESEDLDEPLKKSIKKRVPWLLILLGLGIVVSSVIQVFQQHIPTSLIILYTFQSLVLGMSGNSGTQSLSVTIRLLSDTKITAKEKLFFVLKELKVGVVNGLLIGSVAFLAIGCYLQFISPSSIAALGVSGFLVSACIGFSLLIAMAVASLDGTLIPILFKKLGIDPAVASGPLITTINDLVAVCTYYGVSILLFTIIL